MIIKGKIYKIRPYVDSECLDLNNIGFMESEEGIQLNGQIIKIIPILLEELRIKGITSDKVEVDGDIEFKQIITLLGRPSLLPVPTLRVRTIDKVS